MTASPDLRPSRLLLPVMLALGGLAAMAPADAAAQAVTRSHPLPIVLDDRQLPGALWIRFTETVIEEDLETYARRSHDPAGQAFVRLTRALADKDVAKARPLLLPRHQAPLAGLMDIMHQAFNGFRGLTVVSRVTVGEREVWYLRFPGADRRPVTQGIWLRPGPDGFKGWVVESADPAELLIRRALDATAEAPSVFPPVAQSGAEYSLPADERGGVRLEFSGTVAEFSVFDDEQAPFSAASALFRQAMLELLRSDWLAFATHFTPISARRIGEWVTGRPAEVLEVSKALPQLTLRVLFEIPVSNGGAWMFYSQGLGPDHSDDTVRVSRAAGDGRGALKLTSYRKRDLVLKSIFRLPGMSRQAGPLMEHFAKHRVGGTR